MMPPQPPAEPTGEQAHQQADEPAPSPPPPPPPPPPLPQDRSVPPPPLALIGGSGLPPPGYAFQFGDIGVTTDTIVTPTGDVPLPGSTWSGFDYTTTEEKTPVWATVLAVVFFPLCFVGLLFLLVKEQQTAGWVQVRVQSQQFSYAANIPITSQEQVVQIMAQLGQVHGLAGGHRW